MLQTKTARRLQELKYDKYFINHLDVNNERTKEIISFKNELKEIMQKRECFEVYKTLIDIKDLIQEIESVENQTDFRTSNKVGSVEKQ